MPQPERSTGASRVETIVARFGTLTIAGMAGKDGVLANAACGRVFSIKASELAVAIAGGRVRREGGKISALAVQEGDNARSGGRTAIAGYAPARSQAAVNANESPLAMLARLDNRRGMPWIDALEFNAGERLRSDYERAQLMQAVTMNWDPNSGIRSAGNDGVNRLGDSALEARKRVNDALAAVGPEMSGLLVDVCCFLKGMEQVERERAWPRRSAKLMVKAALSMLARHYDPATNRTRKAVIRHWGAEGYRPEIS